MKTQIIAIVLSAGCFALAACQRAPEAAAESSQPVIGAQAEASLPLATETALPRAPTDFPLPTDTANPGLIPVTGGRMFRDDFNAALQPGWEWEYEYPALRRITDDGFLQITGGYESLWEEQFQTNLLWYPLPDGDFVITVHLKARPSKNFQQAAVILYENPENYLTINRGYCDLCATSGSGIYMHYLISGDRDNYEVKEAAEDVYLRLERSGNTMTGSYALEPERWKVVGRFGYNFRFRRAGLGVSNVHADSPLTAYFDYFELFVP